MKPHYSLLDEPWIRAIDQTGEQRQYGIRQILSHAHLLRALTDASPNDAICRYHGCFEALSGSGTRGVSNAIRVRFRTTSGSIVHPLGRRCGDKQPSICVAPCVAGCD